MQFYFPHARDDTFFSFANKNIYNYLLQASCSTEETSEFLGAISGIHQTSEKERERHSSNSQQGIER